MKSYLFNSDDFILISYIKANPPKKIWWSPIFYVFEYEDFYLRLDVYCCEKEHIKIYSECNLRVSLSKVDGQFSDGFKILTENKKITDIYIVRTIMYYHDFRDSNYLNNKNYNFSGWFLENPNQKLDEDIINNETLSIVDVGLLIQIENAIIDAYIKDNSDDFYKYGEDYLIDNGNLNNFPIEYEYIKFE